MFAGLPTTHVHASMCKKNFWFCILMEAWARGKYPGKEYVLQMIDEVEQFINGLNNNCLEHYRLICVPLKDGADGKEGEDRRKPPRIALDDYGGAVWRYEKTDSENSVALTRGPLSSLEDPNASGVAAPEGTSYSLTKMAAYVKGVMAVGSKVYSECVRVAGRKRRIDKEWELKSAEFEVEGQVMNASDEPERFKRRRIDQQWHSRMDEWQREKRQCQRLFEKWRSVKACGSGAIGGVGNIDNGDDDDVDDDGNDVGDVSDNNDDAIDVDDEDVDDNDNGVNDADVGDVDADDGVNDAGGEDGNDGVNGADVSGENDDDGVNGASGDDGNDVVDGVDAGGENRDKEYGERLMEKALAYVNDGSEVWVAMSAETWEMAMNLLIPSNVDNVGGDGGGVNNDNADAGGENVYVYNRDVDNDNADAGGENVYDDNRDVDNDNADVGGENVYVYTREDLLRE